MKTFPLSQKSRRDLPQGKGERVDDEGDDVYGAGVIVLISGARQASRAVNSAELCRRSPPPGSGSSEAIWMIMGAITIR